MKRTSCTSSPRRRVVAVALCALLATAPLAGCGQQTEEPQAPGTYTVKTSAVSTDQVECSDAALVVTAAQGQAFRVPNNALAFAKAAVEDCGYVSTVDAAGSVDGAVYTATSNSKANKREETDTNTKAVFKSICNLRATKPEVDLLTALNAAASDLQANAVGDRKAMCVVASGISTTGLLATTPELLAADAHDVVAQLHELNAIGNFNGIDVHFYGLGQTTGAQTMPASAAGKNAALLAAVVEEGGGTAVVEPDQLTPLGCDDELPACTAMAFESDALTLPTVAPGESVEVTLDNAQLQFVGDEATFADPEAAQALLGSIAEQVRERGYAVEVEGHTAASQLYPDHGMDLSARRAQAVADALTARGVDPAQVTAAGVGDRDSTSLASGTFDEAQAAQDRKVVLRFAAS